VKKTTAELHVIRERKKQDKRDAAKVAKLAGVGPTCGCGCGGVTGGGTYLPGHDAKHKSLLVKAVLAGGADAAEAEATLEAKNWLRFLEKAKVTAEKAKRPAQVKKQETDEEAKARAAAKLARLNLLKQAGSVVKQLQRYNSDAKEKQVVVSVENAQAIVEGTFDYSAHDAAAAAYQGANK
jgi:hypothetical protein